MSTKNRLLELDCLRGIAAISVVFFHLTRGRPEGNNIFSLGVTGVDLFFMISGFVIFLTLEKTKTINEFLLSRFSRLYPTYWVCVTITTVLTIVWKVVVKLPSTFPTIKDYIFNLTMIQYYFGVRDIDGPYWTLAIELFFYLFMLILFIVKKLKHVELIGFFIVLIAVLYSAVLKTHFYTIYNSFNLYLPFINYSPLFFAGIIFYKTKFQQFNLIRGLLLTFCLIVQIFIYNDRAKIHIAISNLQYGVMVTLYFVAFLLYLFNYLSFIVNKVTLFLGRISYSLYLIHQYISVNLILPFLTHSKYFHFNFWAVIFIVVLPTILLSAYLLNKFVEIPSMLFLKKKFAPPKIIGDSVNGVAK